MFLAGPTTPPPFAMVDGCFELIALLWRNIDGLFPHFMACHPLSGDVLSGSGNLAGAQDYV